MLLLLYPPEIICAFVIISPGKCSAVCTGLTWTLCTAINARLQHWLGACIFTILSDPELTLMESFNHFCFMFPYENFAFHYLKENGKYIKNSITKLL